MPNTEIQDALVLDGDDVTEAIELVRQAMHAGAQI